MRAMKAKRIPPHVRCAFCVLHVLIMLGLCGCTIRLTERDTRRMVNHLLEGEREPTPYASVQRVTDAGDGGVRVRYELLFRRDTAQYYRFLDAHDGFSYWIWDGKAEFLDTSRGVRDVFQPLPAFSEDQRRENLTLVAGSLLRNNQVVVSTGVSHGEWSCNRLSIQPRVRSALWFGNISLYEKETGATVLMQQEGATGAMTHAISLESLDRSPAPARRPPPVPRQPHERVFLLVPEGQGGTAPAPAPEAVHPFLSAPRYLRSDWIDCYDFTRGGQMLALFRRPNHGPGLVSPLALQTTIRGQPMAFWWMGSPYFFIRWSTEAHEYTILTNLPANLVEAFIEGNAGWLGLPGLSAGAGAQR